MRIRALAFAAAMSAAIVTPTFADSAKKTASDPNEPGRRLIMNALPFILPSPLFALYMMKMNKDDKKN
jgi:hypothetical protein